MVKKTIFFFLAAATLFSACKKNDTAVVKTTAQKVIAKWAVSSLVLVNYKSGVGTTYTTATTAADYIDFRTDGNSYAFVQNIRDTAIYQVINDQSIKLKTDTMQIKTLTNNSFILVAKQYYRTDSSITTISLKK